MSLLEHYPDMLTVPEAAEILRTDPAIVNGFIHAGEITCMKIAGKILIPRKYLEIFIEKGCEVCYNENIETGHPASDSQGQSTLTTA